MGKLLLLVNKRWNHKCFNTIFNLNLHEGLLWLLQTSLLLKVDWLIGKLADIENAFGIFFSISVIKTSRSKQIIERSVKVERAKVCDGKDDLAVGRQQEQQGRAYCSNHKEGHAESTLRIAGNLLKPQSLPLETYFSSKTTPHYHLQTWTNRGPSIQMPKT